jgi:hypothetical protein
MTTLAMISIFVYVLLFCAIIYAIRYYIDFVKFKNSKNDIALLDAKIIALKMALRVRVKIKLTSFRDRFGKFINQDDEIDKALNEIYSIKYDSGVDFQRYFDVSKQMIATMKNDMRFAAQFKELNEQQNQGSEDSETVQLFKDFSGPDYKNEIALVRVIKEITDTNNKLSIKVEEFNNEYRNRKKFRPNQVVNPITFSFLAEINVIFQDSEILLKELQRKKSDFFNHAA